MSGVDVGGSWGSRPRSPPPPHRSEENFKFPSEIYLRHCSHGSIYSGYMYIIDVNLIALFSTREPLKSHLVQIKTVHGATQPTILFLELKE